MIENRTPRIPSLLGNVLNVWCTVEYVKITFPEDVEEDTKEILELLESATAKQSDT